MSERGAISQQCIASQASGVITGGWRYDPHRITTDEIAEFLECSVDKVMELLHDQVLPGVKFGKKWVIPRDAFYTVVSKIAVEATLKRPIKRN